MTNFTGGFSIWILKTRRHSHDEKKLEGIPGLRKRISQARGIASCPPCFETSKVIHVASIVRFTGLTSRRKTEKNGEELDREGPRMLQAVT